MGKSVMAGYEIHKGISLKMFSNNELEAIHSASLEVLDKTGIKVESKEARDIFDGGGCIVDEKTHVVKIPNHVVEDSIRSAPSKVLMAGRTSKNDHYCSGKTIGFANFGMAVKINDPITGKQRQTTKQDVIDVTRACDAMDQTNVLVSAVSAGDVPQQVEHLHEAECFFVHSSKPVVSCSSGKYVAQKIIEMAAAVVGGKDKLRERPIYSCPVCPLSPLQLTSNVTETIIECAKAWLPVRVLSMAMAGATTPVTLAGTLVTHNAEVLSGIVLTQLTQRGCPNVYASSSVIFDLRKGASPVGSPELALLSAAVPAIARYYNMPSWVAGG